jgi:hypothetical protein
MQNLFLTEHSFSDHIDQYLKNPKTYMTAFSELYQNKDFKKSMGTTTRGMVCAILLNFLHRHENIPLFLYIKWELPDVVLGCDFLDTKRQIKQLKSNGKNNEKLAQLEKRNLNFSLSLAKIKIVRKWVKSINEHDLILLNVFYNNCELWKSLADLCHFKPTDFCLDWFLNYCYTGKYPENSLLHQIKTGNENTLKSLYLEYNVPYEFLRLRNTSKDFKSLVVQKESLRTVLWYAEEMGIFEDSNLDNLICERVKKEKIDLPYTKLLQIIVDNVKYKNSKLISQLTLYSQSKLEEYKLNLPTPIGILCDASGSMEICIKTAGIITSLLSAIAGDSCKLYIFRDNNETVKTPPKNVQDVLTFIQNNKAHSATSPASSLDQMIQDGVKPKTIIVITDQEENTHCKNLNFSETYKKYCNILEYRPKIIFITMGTCNLMIDSLVVNFGSSLISEIVSNYKFDAKEPDLRKMDSILSILCSQTCSPQEEDFCII